ncbi:nucleotidyl transferase AbiEii/AbiGii toxin family protein [Gracilinema caldarium]|uniref:Nucleotidyl transferase AbiEii/AbiGii toxin family protein n=1 Tax=Gracilinema caldarium (strain ATCC 51460 / DSM 7334 / H1) TaxID=744872 RepID=F8EYJ1_GRAC1|nr:nucleotidyl transferase AbiEii/AbiGii toxin family protein [Gracilinema caldarium]AEJ18423.1 Domain of unknown function DUF1814 [Gracilinema caldarium DSM 7334]
MKEEAIRFAQRTADPTGKLNMLREYVQAQALHSFHESRAFEALSFVGGTALRFLFDLPRYSEDLDFSLEIPQSYAPEAWMAKLKRDLMFQNFDVEISWNSTKPIHTGWIRIAGIMKDAGLSARPEQKLSIKIEIDTNPPPGAVTMIRLVNRHALFAVRHHDLPSLMAGKLNALITRPFTKGRDWYDAVWYLSKIPPIDPNTVLLSSALKQFGIIYKDDWRSLLREKLRNTDFGAVRTDVRPFLERPEDANYLTQEYLEHLLG